MLGGDAASRALLALTALVMAGFVNAVTRSLPYYPAAWQLLLVAVVAAAWLLRPTSGPFVTMVGLLLPIGHALGYGPYGLGMGAALALWVAITLEPYSFAVIASATLILLVAGLSGLVAAVPLALGVRPRGRAAAAAALASVGVLAVSVAVGHTVAPGAVAVPVLPPLLAPVTTGVTSLVDLGWVQAHVTDRQISSFAAGVLQPFVLYPVLVGQVGLWVVVAGLVGALIHDAPWAPRLDNVLAALGVDGASALAAWSGVPAVMIGALAFGCGELALVALLTPDTPDGATVLGGALASGVAVALLLPILVPLAQVLQAPRWAPRVSVPRPDDQAAPTDASSFAHELPRDSWDDLAGVDGIRVEIEEAVASQFDRTTRERLRTMGLRPTRGIVLFGPPGTGKTKIARVIAASAGVGFFAVSGSEFSSKWFGQSESNLRQIFEEAQRARPVVLFFDELEAFLPKRTEMSRADAPEKRVVGTFLGLTDGVADLDGILLVGATNYPNLIDEAALRPGRFDKVIYVSPPDRPARQAIFARLMRDRPLAQDVDLGALAGRTERFTGADIAALCAEATRAALRRSGTDAATPALVTGADFDTALAGMHPSVTLDMLRQFEALADRHGRRSERATDVQVVERPTLTWDDVAGLDSVKEALHEAIELPLEQPDLLREYGVRPSKGVLLFGPPGCGKTYLARVVASVAGAHFLQVRGPELLQSHVGASEAQLRDLFARARENTPCVLFFDEIDAFATARGSLDAGRTQLLTQLLVEMDGFDEVKGVVVVAATNRPDVLDPALLRPGRFDRVLYVPPPDGPARKTLFNHELAGKPLGPDVAHSALAVATDGYSAADIAAICRSAAVAAAKEAAARGERVPITMTVLQEQIARSPASLTRAQLAGYEALRDRLAR